MYIFLIPTIMAVHVTEKTHHKLSSDYFGKRMPKLIFKAPRISSAAFEGLVLLKSVTYYKVRKVQHMYYLHLV